MSFKIFKFLFCNILKIIFSNCILFAIVLNLIDLFSQKQLKPKRNNNEFVFLVIL